jgi:hypothetical protein
MGFGELLLVLLAFGGFGVKANPNAPTQQQVARWAVDDADAVVFADLEAVVPHNWDYFVKLPNDPTIKSVPAIANELAKTVREAEGGRAMLRGQIGMDLVTDLKWGAIWVRAKAKGEPDFVGVAGGKFPADFIDKIAAMDKKPVVKVDGRSAMEDKGHIIAVSADGMLVFGTTALVKSRLAASWKGAGKAGSVTDRATELFAEKPFFLVAFKATPALLKLAEAEMKGAELALVKDFLVGHDFFGLVVTANGFGWTSVTKSAVGYGRALMASEGMIQIVRAGHLFVRGAAQVILASLDSYVGVDPSLAKVVKQKAELWRLVTTWTGDGNFAVKLDKEEAKRRVAVRLTGKSLADVFPIGAAVVPAGLGALYFVMRDVSTVPTPSSP